MTRTRSGFAGALLSAALGAMAAAPAAAQIEVIYSTYVAQGSASNLQYEAFLEELGKRTQGYIKVKDKLFMAALLKAGDHLTGVGKGLADVGYFCTGYTPALLPLTSMAELPFVTDKGDAVSATLADLYDSYEPLKKEYQRQNVEVLAFDAPSATILGVNKAITAPAQLKGLKVRAYGDLGKIVGKTAGMVPVPMATTDIYTGLQTGAIDGYVGVPLWMPGPENWLQYTKTVIAPGIGTYYTCGLAMNLDLYKKLPQNVKDEIAKMRREFPAKSIDFVVKGDAASVKKAQDLKVGFYKFSPAEVDEWKKLSEYDALKAEWIKSRQARTDANVADFLKVYQETLQKNVPKSTYEQKFP